MSLLQEDGSCLMKGISMVSRRLVKILLRTDFKEQYAPQGTIKVHRLRQQYAPFGLFKSLQDLKSIETIKGEALACMQGQSP